MKPVRYSFRVAGRTGQAALMNVRGRSDGAGMKPAARIGRKARVPSA